MKPPTLSRRNVTREDHPECRRHSVDAEDLFRALLEDASVNRAELGASALGDKVCRLFLAGNLQVVGHLLPALFFLFAGVCSVLPVLLQFIHLRPHGPGGAREDRHQRVLAVAELPAFGIAAVLDRLDHGLQHPLDLGAGGIGHALGLRVRDFRWHYLDERRVERVLVDDRARRQYLRRRLAPETKERDAAADKLWLRVDHDQRRGSETTLAGLGLMIVSIKRSSAAKAWRISSTYRC